MSAELIATLSAFVAIGLGVFAGFAWMIRRMDSLEDRLGNRIDAVEGTLGNRIDAVEGTLGDRIDALGDRVGGVESALTEVKISIARLEGPERHLILAR